MSAEETTEQPQATADAPASAAPSPSSTDPTTSAEPTKENTERDENGRYRRPIQPRIDELTRARHEAQREAAYWRQRAESQEAAKPAPEPPAKPTPDKFDDYGAYVEALADFKANEKVRAALAERDQQSQAKTIEQTRSDNWAKGLAAARAAHPDYDEVMSASEVQVARHVQMELLDSEHGPQLSYYLDRHPDVAQRLNGMTEKQVARELGRLESVISANTSPTPVESAEPEPVAAAPRAQPAATRTTSAPPPVRPAGAGRSASIPLEKQSMDDYVKSRKSQGASWAGR